MKYAGRTHLRRRFSLVVVVIKMKQNVAVADDTYRQLYTRHRQPIFFYLRTVKV